MSRIGKKPVPVPSGVKVAISGQNVKVEGPKGNLSLDLNPLITVEQQENAIVCQRVGDDRKSKALHGLYRSLIRNMMDGVNNGFVKKLEIVGVGYNASVEGKNLKLTVGYCNPVILPIPEGLTIKVEGQMVTVSGADKQAVGQFAAVIRSARKPEPYKGTGIKYEGEQIRRKAGKAFGKGA